MWAPQFRLGRRLHSNPSRRVLCQIVILLLVVSVDYLLCALPQETVAIERTNQEQVDKRHTRRDLSGEPRHTISTDGNFQSADADYPLEQLSGHNEEEEDYGAKMISNNQHNSSSGAIDLLSKRHDSEANQTSHANNIELLVRSQLAFADWAKIEPREYLLDRLADNHPSYLQLFNQTGEPLLGHQAHSMPQPRATFFHPNHNYDLEQQHRENATTSAPQSDPMTTLSDGSNRYSSLSSLHRAQVQSPEGYPGRYLYRLRGPITAGPSSRPNGRRQTQEDSDDSSPQMGRKVVALAAAQPTLAPAIVSAFERLDRLRNAKMQEFDEEAYGRASKQIFNRKKFQSLNWARGDDRINNEGASAVHTLFANPKSLVQGSSLSSLLTPSSQPLVDSVVDSGAGKISPQGFIDLALPTTSTLIQESGNSASGEYSNGQIASTTSSGHLAQAPTTAVPSEPFTSSDGQTLSINGSLAARLNANRYKNVVKQPGRAANSKRLMSTTSTTTTASSSLAPDETPEQDELTGNQLVINFKRPQDSPGKIPTASPTRDAGLFSLQSSLNQRLGHSPAPILQTTSRSISPLPLRNWSQMTTLSAMPTTLQQTTSPSTHDFSNVTPAPQSLAHALAYVASLRPSWPAPASSLLSNNSNLLSAAHHHHLHSHVHNIKPAIISIPVPVHQQPAQPKFNAYEGVLSAAAAAAAAATTASRAVTRTGNGPHRAQRLPYVLMGAGPRAHELLESQRLSSLRANHRARMQGQHNTIPIGGTLASIPYGHRNAALLAESRPSGPRPTANKPRPRPQSQSSGILASLLQSASRALRLGSEPGASKEAAKADQLPQLLANELLSSSPSALLKALPDQRLPLNSASLFQHLTTPTLIDVDSLVDADGAQDQYLTAESLPYLSLEEVAAAQKSPAIDQDHLDLLASMLITGDHDPRHLAEESLRPLVELTQLGESTSELLRKYNLTNSELLEAPKSSAQIHSLADQMQPIIASLIDSMVLASLKTGLDGSDVGDQLQRLNQTHIKDYNIQDLSSSLVSTFDSPQWNSSHDAPAGGTQGKTSASKSKAVRVARPHGQIDASGLRVHHQSFGQNPKHSRAKSNKAGAHKASNPLAGPSPLMPYALSHYADEPLQIYGAQFGDPTADSLKSAEHFTQFSLPQLDLSDSLDTSFRPISSPVQYGSGASLYSGLSQAAKLNLTQSLYGNPYYHSSEESRAKLLDSRPALNLISGEHPHKAKRIKKAHGQGSVVQQSSLEAEGQQTSFAPSANAVAGSQHQISLTKHPAFVSQTSQPPHTHLFQLVPSHYLTITPSGGAEHLLQQALIQAGSSLKPHLIAHATDLLDHHRQLLASHLVDSERTHHGHMLHHNHAQQASAAASAADLTTSESAHLSAFGGHLPGARALLLSNFWPLALALLPIMIIVAIVAQLVMAAPLAMFALTTLTLSRVAGSLFGPPGIIREDAVSESSAPAWSPRAPGRNSTHSWNQAPSTMANVVKLATVPSASFIASIWPTENNVNKTKIANKGSS